MIADADGTRPDEAGSALQRNTDHQTTANDMVQPSTLVQIPGVSTSLFVANREVTLDIRWTLLCDLFLLMADSVRNARSRVLVVRVVTTSAGRIMLLNSRSGSRTPLRSRRAPTR
jgi:hypothetical protein